jgi:hypothetical protein
MAVLLSLARVGSDQSNIRLANGMRASGTISILVYCADYRSSHSIEMSADQWPDDVRLSDIEPRFVCKACGKRGADVRPHFEPARMGTAKVRRP